MQNKRGGIVAIEPATGEVLALLTHHLMIQVYLLEDSAQETTVNWPMTPWRSRFLTVVYWRNTPRGHHLKLSMR